eukprot:TRINITY_DN4655_c0_g1_i1.p1 TRINITY_DN4655_c0_g1~~TRINITY_DN4655_c0_g1_i1.p1  ORF type:complete len:1078 (+),score=357.45 TRINITY_DN4655_c0_g1_i1:1291-4524(+)
MEFRTDPQISPVKKSESYVKISFKPDLERFGYKSLDDDIMNLFKKRVYDVAGCNSSLQVYWNDTKIKIKSFTDYVSLYLEDTDLKNKIAYETIYDKTKRKRWEVAVTMTDGDPQQVSFVNSICTLYGGTHVNHVQTKVVNHLRPILEKKAKQEVQPQTIKNFLWFFVNSLITNPEFDSQTKEKLKNTAASFEPKCDLSAKTLKAIEKIGVMERIIEFSKMKSALSLSKNFAISKKKKNRITGYEHLIDANNAGGKKSASCTLILTEGVSAKALAVAGMSVIGRDNYGVFALRGKVLNVRQATGAKVSKNAEIQALMQIIGLNPDEEYDDTKKLRYGHIMVMTDQDVDGSHIKGLLINFIHYYWPSLFKMKGFLTQFITPILKATKGNKVVPFYSIPEYEDWKRNNNSTGWKIKYYKGLGTSTPEEAIEYFEALNKHKKDFLHKSSEDDKAIVMAFANNDAKTKATDKRKDWINAYDPATFLKSNTPTVSYKDFVNKELVLFSREDCSRSIPSVVDGLKPGQRKILFSCFKRKLVKEIRVAQLAGYVSEVAAYHHGEASLQSTIVGMAQNFIGANNVPLLHPQGQFGTRLEGGKDAASARYIHTFLSVFARALFNPADDNIVEYLDDDGLSIEPKWYVPVIPLALVNGSAGIGTGYSSKIPNYNPRDIVNNLYRLLAGKKVRRMLPWYRGFKGVISRTVPKSKNVKGDIKVEGKWRRVNDNTLEITELPVGVWTVAYKAYLENLLTGPDSDAAKAKAKTKKQVKKKPGPKAKKKDEKDKKDKPPPIKIEDYKDYCTHTMVKFIVTYSKLKDMDDAEVVKVFKLSKTMATTNMYLYDADGKITKYDSPEILLQSFYNVRLDCYEKRKAYLVGQLHKDFKKLENKVRFIQAVINEEINVRNRPKADLTKELEKSGYDRFPEERKAKKKEKEEEESDEEEDEEGEKKSEKKKPDTRNQLERDYDYLLSMKIWSLTKEQVDFLKKKLAEKKKELEELQKRTPQDLWYDDLDLFMEVWNAYEKEMVNFDEVMGAKKTKSKPKLKSLSLKTIMNARAKKGREVPRPTFSDEEPEVEEVKKRRTC